MGHKLLVGDQLEPSKSKCWVLIRVKLDEQIRKAEKNKKMSFLVKALRMIHCSQNIHQHSVVGLLVELCLFSSVLFI